MATIAPKSLRDEFAMAALTGLLAFGWNIWPRLNARKSAKEAYEYADAMIAARIQTIEMGAPVTLDVDLSPDSE